LKIRISKSAVIDLQQIEDYIQPSNPAAAARTVLRVLDAIKYLLTYPTMGRLGRVAKTRELIISSTPFIVIYQIRGSIIVVLRIFHASRKWPK